MFTILMIVYAIILFNTLIFIFAIGYKKAINKETKNKRIIDTRKDKKRYDGEIYQTDCDLL